MNVSLALLNSQFSRSDKDGCADTGQQERIVTLHLCALGAVARGKTPKESQSGPGAAGVRARSRRRPCTQASRDGKNQAVRRLALLPHGTGYFFARRARG